MDISAAFGKGTRHVRIYPTGFASKVSSPIIKQTCFPKDVNPSPFLWPSSLANQGDATGNRIQIRCTAVSDSVENERFRGNWGLGEEMVKGTWCTANQLTNDGYIGRVDSSKPVLEQSSNYFEVRQTKRSSKSACICPFCCVDRQEGGMPAGGPSFSLEAGGAMHHFD